MSEENKYTPVLVMNVTGGKGYCPYELLKEGKTHLAAKIAKRCFDLRK